MKLIMFILVLFAVGCMTKEEIKEINEMNSRVVNCTCSTIKGMPWSIEYYYYYCSCPKMLCLLSNIYEPSCIPDPTPIMAEKLGP